MINGYYTIGGVLYHHGILGQKWGKQNGPPYPLQPGDHSSAEKKAAKGKGRTSSGGSTQSGMFNNRKKTRFLKKNTSNKSVKDINQRNIDEDTEIDKMLEEEYKKGKYSSYEEADEHLMKTNKKYRDLWGVSDEKVAAMEIKKKSESNQPQTEQPKEHTKTKFTEDQQKSMLENAKKNDRYSMEYMELIQNTEMNFNDDKKEIDKEYAIYLKDPNAYYDRVKTLKQA